MSILTRFKDIISSNINALLDKAEDPGKMIDQYLRNLADDLAEVKKETAGVMAEESRTRRLVEENDKEEAKYEALAKKALLSGNEDDARVFLTKKQEIGSIGASLETAYASAKENAVRMRQMHDKLASDIETLRQRRNVIKVQASIADTQEKLNKVKDTTGASSDAASNFKRMEEKVSQRLDQAKAMEELNQEPIDSAKSLEEKYAQSHASASVESELESLKSSMGLSESDE